MTRLLRRDAGAVARGLMLVTPATASDAWQKRVTRRGPDVGRRRQAAATTLS